MNLTPDEHGQLLTPEAEVIQVVFDTLITHTPAALYEAFPPAEAQRILQRLDFHYTLKHSSRLNIAEIELSVSARQCLRLHLPDKATGRQEIGAWEAQRNAAMATVQWRFTTQDARVKLSSNSPAR